MLVDAEAVADEECMCFSLGSLCFSLGSLGFSLGSLKFGLSLTIGNKQIRSKLFYPILRVHVFFFGFFEI